MEYNEDSQPRFLKGIDSYHDLGKSDEVLNSLIMIKECFLINKLKKNFTPENEAKRLLGSLAKKALDEILKGFDVYFLPFEVTARGICAVTVSEFLTDIIYGRKKST
jgi:hypothetical protein